MKSYMGIDCRIDGEWVLVAAAETDYHSALDEAPKVAAALGCNEYRVRRLTREECLEKVEDSRLRPRFPCPRCGGVMLLDENKKKARHEV